MSGIIKIETADTGCWIVPGDQLGEAHNANAIQSFEIHPVARLRDKDDKHNLIAYMQPERVDQAKLYTGTESQCVRMLNKMLDAISIKIVVIRLWKLALEIEAEDEEGKGLEDLVK